MFSLSSNPSPAIYSSPLCTLHTHVGREDEHVLNAAGADDTDGVVALLAGDAHDKTAVGLVRELVLGILAVVGLCAEPRLLL